MGRVDGMGGVDGVDGGEGLTWVKGGARVAEGIAGEEKTRDGE